MKIHCEPVYVDNGASAYAMKEDTRLEGPLEFSKSHGGDRKSAKWQEKNRNILSKSLNELVDNGEIRVE